MWIWTFKKQHVYYLVFSLLIFIFSKDFPIPFHTIHLYKFCESIFFRCASHNLSLSLVIRERYFSSFFFFIQCDTLLRIQWRLKTVHENGFICSSLHKRFRCMCNVYKYNIYIIIRIFIHIFLEFFFILNKNWWDV